MEYKKVNYTLYQLLEIFPEAKSYVRKKLKREIYQWREDFREADRIEIECKKITTRPTLRYRWFWEMVAEIIFIPNKKEITKKIKQNMFLLSYLNHKKGVVNDDKITEQDIMRVKEILVQNFYTGNLKKLGNTLTGICPFHLEKTGSFTIYTKQNRWYCYGACGAGGDVIDYIMKIQNLKFTEAVKKLLNK